MNPSTAEAARGPRLSLTFQLSFGGSPSHEAGACGLPRGPIEQGGPLVKLQRPLEEVRRACGGTPEEGSTACPDLCFCRRTAAKKIGGALPLRATACGSRCCPGCGAGLQRQRRGPGPALPRLWRDLPHVVQLDPWARWGLCLPGVMVGPVWRQEPEQLVVPELVAHWRWSYGRWSRLGLGPRRVRTAR
ncbi:hypothetical protein NDU88_006339 [Pleurodeles waltl]|uniref:Uncharacterized protein n=1 Tax=Pleurodeles waltl TaxID=8319 RepID=A0AAV7RPZ1_PLEWA|nr:hypothetical protein NDU88_006339 [Pleurodeles waltl]